MLGDTVVILNAQASDSAVYQCEAANVHGRLLSNANIMIMSEFADGTKQSTAQRLRAQCCEFPAGLQVAPPNSAVRVAFTGSTYKRQDAAQGCPLWARS